MRLDIQEQLERAADASLRFNGTYVVLASKMLLDQMNGDWSEPVRVRFETSDDRGIAEMILQKVEE